MPKKYIVQAPDGKTITIEGPDNASPEEVIKQAQRLYKSNQNADILAAQAAKFPTSAEMGGTPGAPVDPKLSLADRALNFVADEGPAMAGAAIGGAMGLPFGPAGIVGGGALGAAGGELVKQGMRKVIGGGPSAQSLPELGSNINRAMISGALQEGGGAVAAAFPKVAAPVLKAGAANRMEKVLFPTTRENKYLTQKVSAELAERGPVAATKGGFEKKVLLAKEKAGAELEKAWANLGPAGQFGQFRNIKLKTQPIVDAIDKAKDEFIAAGVNILPAATEKLDELKVLIQQFGPSVSPHALRKTRQVWDLIVDKSGGYGYKDLASTSQAFALKEAANAIRAQIGKTFPDIKRLNADFTFWSRVDDILQDRILRETGRGFSLTDVVSGATGLGAFGIEGLAIPAIVRAVQSTGSRTLQSKMMTKLAHAVEKGQWDEVARMAGQATGATAGQVTAPE